MRARARCVAVVARSMCRVRPVVIVHDATQMDFYITLLEKIANNDVSEGARG